MNRRQFKPGAESPETTWTWARWNFETCNYHSCPLILSSHGHQQPRLLHCLISHHCLKVKLFVAVQHLGLCVLPAAPVFVGPAVTGLVEKLTVTALDLTVTVLGLTVAVLKLFE